MTEDTLASWRRQLSVWQLSDVGCGNSVTIGIVLDVATGDRGGSVMIHEQAEDISFVLAQFETSSGRFVNAVLRLVV